MAHAAKLSTLTDDLVTSITGLSPKRQRREFKHAKDLAARGLKAHQYVRVNQFDVQSRLEGLEEKFVVLDREDLAAAYQSRLDEISKRPGRFIPDILALLLELSDDPVGSTSLKALELIKPPQSPPPLTWADILAEDPLDEPGIWDDIDYRAVSSDDDSIVSERTSQAAKKDSVLDENEELLPLEKLTISADSPDIEGIRKAQFWANLGRENDSKQPITELQAIREVLFMLSGLSTSLFAVGEDGKVRFKTEFILAHTLPGTLTNFMLAHSNIGSTLLALRQWARREQSVSLIQTFRSAVQQQIGIFDKYISSLQEKYVGIPNSIVVSLLDVQQHVQSHATLLLKLSDVALNNSGKGPFAYIEALFDELNLAQLCGEEEAFNVLGNIFFKCLQTYLRPIRQWMEEGALGKDDQVFFVGMATHKDGGKGVSLWHDRFELRLTSSGALHAPRFLHPAARRIFNTGKSVVFLKELNLFREDESLVQPEPKLDLGSVCGMENGIPLLQFSELFEAVFDDWIRSKYSQAAATLRTQLHTQCGLLRSLDAIRHIYLSKDGSLFQNFADAVFAKIDRNPRSWNDRFLLTELAQTAFGDAGPVDAEKIMVRSRKLKGKARSIKDLGSFVLDYQLSWPLLNIIQRSSLQTYQQVFCLLLQTYRAKQLLTQTISRVAINVHGPSKSAVYLRQGLIWFVDIFRSYLCETVLYPLDETLQKDLEKAEDIDAMAAVHSRYIGHLQSQCLLSKNLAPIHQAIVQLIDLAVAFYDAQSRTEQAATEQSMLKASTITRRDRRKSIIPDAGSESNSEDEAGDDDYAGDEEDLSPQEVSYEQSLSRVKEQFDRLLPFIIAGLRGVSRSGGEHCWGTLADRLEWR